MATLSITFSSTDSAPVTVAVDLAGVDDIRAAVSRVETSLNEWRTQMAQAIGTVDQELANLQEKVAAGTTLVLSTREMVVGLREQLHANATNPAAVRAIADSLVAQQNEWAAALVENTAESTPMATDDSKAGQDASKL